MQVIIRCSKPEHYEAADAAVIEVTEELILMLDRRMAQARSIFEEGFYGTKWWDYTPTFIPCGFANDVDLDMDDADFEAVLEKHRYVRLADDFDAEGEDYAPMRPVTLTITVTTDKDGSPVGGFYWTGTDKYVGSRVETHDLHQNTLDEWAEAIGCTEALAKVRRCRGEL